MSLRTWQVHTLSDDDFDIDYLFHELAEVAYPLCAGFRYRGFLFRNISTRDSTGTPTDSGSCGNPTA